MDLDDIPVGRVLSRREALAFLGATGALLFLGCSSSADATAPASDSGSCLVRPELTEGPYYVDEELNRSDIRSDRPAAACRTVHYWRSHSMCPALRPAPAHLSPTQWL